jgi:hypothetical protein
VWYFTRIEHKLDVILHLLKDSRNREVHMGLELDALTAKVAETNTVMGSAVALIGGLAAQIEALKTDPAALSALAASLEGSKAALAAAILANTPAAPPA